MAESGARGGQTRGTFVSPVVSWVQLIPCVGRGQHVRQVLLQDAGEDETERCQEGSENADDRRSHSREGGPIQPLGVWGVSRGDHGATEGHVP